MVSKDIVVFYGVIWLEIITRKKNEKETYLLIANITYPRCGSLTTFSPTPPPPPPKKKEKLFVSCNPTLTRFYSKEFLPYSFSRPSNSQLT